MHSLVWSAAQDAACDVKDCAASAAACSAGLGDEPGFEEVRSIVLIQPAAQHKHKTWPSLQYRP